MPFFSGGGGGGGGISGSGTTNTLAKFVDTDEVGDSRITDDGTDINMTAAGTAFYFYLRHFGTGNTSSIYTQSDNTDHFASLGLQADNTPTATADLYADATGISVDGVASTVAVNADPSTGQINLNASVVNVNGNPITPVPKRYVALLTQSGTGSTQTSGELIVGHPYKIVSYVDPDDFTEVGAASNANGVEFVATGTLPGFWGAGSELRDLSVGAPVATVLENSLGGTLVWAYVNSGIYSATLAGAFPDASKVFMPTVPLATSGLVVDSMGVFERNSANVIFLNTSKAPTPAAEGDPIVYSAPADGLLTATSIEIRVYP